MSRTPSQKTMIRRVQSQIDQAEGKITQLAQETSEHEEKITKVEQDVDSIKQNVGDIVDYKRDKEAITEVYLDDAGKLNVLKFDVEGNKTYDNYLFPSTNLFPSANLFPNQKI